MTFEAYNERRRAHDALAYAWEDAHVDFTRNTGLVFRLNELWKDAGRKSVLRISMLPADTVYAAQYRRDKRDHIIVIPPGCGDALALHEFAHALVDAKMRQQFMAPSHGPIWADRYIGLLGEHMGADVKALRESYRSVPEFRYVSN